MRAAAQRRTSKPPGGPARRRAWRPPPDDSHDDIVILEGWTWEDYERLLSIQGDRSVPRVKYLEGTVELMSPSPEHEALARMIGTLVGEYCLARDVDCTNHGSWTVRRRRKKRGAEADECFVFGVPPRPLKRPDLAIEVIWTSGGLDELDVWRKLGVPEVWMWEKGRIGVYVLRGELHEPAAWSTLLPDLDLEHLTSFLGITPGTRAIRAYRASLQRKSRRRRHGPRS